MPSGPDGELDAKGARSQEPSTSSPTRTSKLTVPEFWALDVSRQASHQIDTRVLRGADQGRKSTST